jgi:medium-chain acyl-[acyl-carrier-protein] hydrolase
LIVSGRAAPDVPPSRPMLHMLPDAELVRELQRLDGTPAVSLDHPELARLFLPALRADLTVNETHRYRLDEEPLRVPILALSGRSDPLCTQPQAVAWADQTTADFSHQSFPGGHFFIREHADAVVAAVTGECYARTRHLISNEG